MNVCLFGCIVIVGGVMLTISASHAQSKGGSKNPVPSSVQSGASESDQTDGTLFRNNRTTATPYSSQWAEQKQQEFDQRMEANARKYRKMEKEMKKPQYSDPSYFGHKKKPKKRRSGKQKFCNECGMRH